MLAEKSGANPLRVSRLSATRAPPTARARPLVKHREETKQDRLPLVNCACTCASADKRHNVNRKSADDSDEDSEDDDVTVTLQRMLCALAAGAQNGTRRGSTALRNMAAALPSDHVITPQNIQQLYFYLENDDCVVREGSLCGFAQLVRNERNARLFLEHGLLGRVFECLEQDAEHYMDEAAIQVIENIICHHGLRPQWGDMMTTRGVPILLQKTACENARAVRLAAALAIHSLVRLPDLATLVEKEGFPFIAKLLHNEALFKEICCQILADLVKHSEQALKMTVDNGLFHMTADMLKQGPCGCQQKSILLLAQVGKRESGRQVILRENLVPCIMSALTDSQCRRVREASASVLASMTSTRMTNVYRKLLLQLNRFFEEYDVTLPAPSSGAAGGQNKVLEKTLDQLTDLALKQLTEQARIERRDRDESVEVHLAPCIDTDAGHIGSICHLVTVLLNVMTTPYHKAKKRDTSSGHDSGAKTKHEKTSVTYDQYRIQTRRLEHVIENGGLCSVDLLHAYSSKLITRSCFLNRANATNLPDLHKLRKVCDAWANLSAPQIAFGIHKVDAASVFQPIEMELIGKLLELQLVFSISTTDLPPHKLSNIISDIKSNADTIHPSSKACRHINLGCDGNDDFGEDEDSYVGNRSDCIDEGEEDIVDGRGDDNDATSGVADLHFVGGEQRLARRSLRIRLFETGVIDTAGQLLVCTEPFIKKNALNVLHCMLQPLEEPLFGSPTPAISLSLLSRPKSVMSTSAMSASAMTTIDSNDEALATAFSNMSSKMAYLIRETLSTRKHIRTESNGQHSAHARTDPMLQKRRPQSANTLRETRHNIANNDTARPTRALALKAAEDAMKELDRLGALSWNPPFNSAVSVSEQCQDRLVTVCGDILLAGLLSGTQTSKASYVAFLKYFANTSEISVLMKLSELGCMQKLVDFLRIHDDHEDLEIKGLQLTSTLVTRDNRLRQLFNRHGGWQLLQAMSAYTSGPLRRQVSRTLRDVSSGAGLPSSKTSSTRRIHSAPPVCRRIPDIWDHIGDKWRAQDRVTNVLKRPILE